METGQVEQSDKRKEGPKPLSWQNLVKDFKERVRAKQDQGLGGKEAALVALKEELSGIMTDTNESVLARISVAIELVFSSTELADSKNYFEPVELDEPTKIEMDGERETSGEQLTEIILRDIVINRKLIAAIMSRVASRGENDQKFVADIAKISGALELIRKHLARKEKREPTLAVEMIATPPGQKIKNVLDFGHKIREAGGGAGQINLTDKLAPFIVETLGLERIIYD